MEEICIIGGGVVGILSAKISISKGLVPVIFEKSSSVGGVWTANPSMVGRWDSLVTNLSQYMMIFSDHLWPEGTPSFPSGAQYLEYIHSYVDKHQLQQYIQFNTEVTLLEKDDTEGYQVSYKTSQGVYQKHFKYVIVANGYFSKPKNFIKHKEKFQGLTFHSGYYRDPKVFEGKKVVVVGSGYSGCDLSYEASKFAESVTQIHRKKFCINTRMIGGVPGEFHAFNFQCLEKNPPLFFSIESHSNSIRDLISALGNPGELNEELRISDEEINTSYIAYPISCPEYYESIRSNKIKCIRGAVAEYCERGIVLSTGEVIEADVLVDATGYSPCHDFLGDKIKEIANFDPTYPRLPLTMYRNSVHPGLPGLAFAGYIQSFFTGLFELSAELCLRWVTGTLEISSEELWEGIRLEKEYRDESLRALWVYDLIGFQKEILRILKIQVDIDLARELGFIKGLMAPVFFFPERPGQKEIAREYVRRVKQAFPEFQFE